MLVTVTRYNDGSSITAQTNSQGEVSFICNTGVTNFYCTYSGSSTPSLTLPCVIPQAVETTTQYDHVVEDTDNSLITDTVHSSGYSTFITSFLYMFKLPYNKEKLLHVFR